MRRGAGRLVAPVREGVRGEHLGQPLVGRRQLRLRSRGSFEAVDGLQLLELELGGGGR
jgi:hypothetical protein